MKNRILLVILTAAAALLSAPMLRAQDDPAPAPAALRQAEDATRAAQDQAARAQADAQAQVQKAEAEAREGFAQARQQMELAQKQVAQASADIASERGGGAYAGTPVFTDRLQKLVTLHGPGQGGKALVIRSSEADPKEQAELEQDLKVMSHILEKAASERAGGHSGEPFAAKAMGIDVFYSPGSSPLRSLYLEGYGALFMLNVGFPLLPPPQAEGQKETPEASSDWEEAKQELYGHPGGGGRAMAMPSEPYDEERVNRLREGLLESLKNATNIRGLKPDDWITVCVFGGPSSGQPKARAIQTYKRATGSTEAPGKVTMSVHGGSPMHQTTLTIRVRKSDADAFAKGSMTLEAFRKKAHIVSYAGSPEVGAENGAWVGGFGGGGGGFSFGGGGGGGGVGGSSGR